MKNYSMWTGLALTVAMAFGNPGAASAQSLDAPGLWRQTYGVVYNFPSQPTYMTSINYPVTYGAYNTRPYGPGIFYAGLSRSGAASMPSIGPRLVINPPELVVMTKSPITGLATIVPAAGAPETATLEIRVPENAEVVIEGKFMTEQGDVRRFVSPPLESGKTYTYDVRAYWTANNVEYNDKRQVQVQAGDRVKVTFDAAPSRGTATLRTGVIP